MWKMAVCTAMMQEIKPCAAAAMVKRLGFEGVEWRIHESGHFPLSREDEAREGIHRLREETGLEVVCLSSYLRLDEVEPIQRLARLAERLGVAMIRIWPPGFDRQRDRYPELLTASRAALRQVEAVARSYGVKAAVEMHFGTVAPSAGLSYRLVESLDPRHVGIIYDPGNMVREGLERWRMGLQLLGPYLAHVHVKNGAWSRDAEGNWDVRWVPLWEGQVNWVEVLEDLQAVGYTGYLSLEDFCPLPVQERLKRDRDWLLAHMPRAGMGA